jgi:hypothetical protein
MKLIKTSHSSSGEYYENGHMYPASMGSVSMEVAPENHNAAIYWKHYYANLGNMKEQISREEYLSLLGKILASHGTNHPTYGCKMSVWMNVEQCEGSGYDWTGRNAMPINFGLGRRG